MRTSLSLDDTIIITVYLRRDLHTNGMTLEEYADGVIEGTHPVLSQDEFVYQFGAIEDEINLVINWATTNGLSVVESSAGMAVVKIDGSISKFNNLFNITMRIGSDGDREYYTYDGELTVPDEINSVVLTIGGLDNSFTFEHNAIQDSSTNPFDPNLISSPSPIDLALAYKFPRSNGSNQSQGYGQCVGIVSLGGGYTTDNLTSTFSRIGLSNPTVVDVSVDGGTNNPGTYDANGSSAEVMLDIYCVGAISPSAKIVQYFSPNTYQGFADCILAAANDTTNNPSVLSISWGSRETNFYSVYTNIFEAAFQTAVTKGITVFVAQGDYGTKATSSSSYGTFSYPGTSPYVVSCGGTVMSVNNDYTIASERAWGGSSDGGFAGGGGVSTVFTIPSWQSGKGYSTKTYTGTVASLTTRGVPDMAAMATGYTFYWYDYTSNLAGYPKPNVQGTFLGTSAVAPLLAGMMARINQLAGRRIGFINSDLYNAQNTAFNDITTGSNTLSSGTTGYQATTGWDACTGLGSPKANEIYKLYHTGSTFPKVVNGFRPATGTTYPRVSSGVR